jgi:serine/threonine protein kinase
MEIPGFEQCEKIAESGFASYWKAFQSSLNRHVTLVVMRPDAVANPESRRYFLRDIRIVAGLKHPALFQVYDVLEMDASLVVIVEHVSGVTLRQYVRQRGRVGGEKALTVVRWIAEGLSHVYEKTGLVHLSLTPDQIWIDETGQVKILGFGFNDIFERIGYSALDVPFLSPEQVQHRIPFGFSADLYSLGSLFYFMLTGRPPFDGNSSEQILDLIVKAQLPAPMSLVTGTTMAQNQLLVRLMMKESEERYAGWIPAMQVMDKVLDGAKFLPGKKGGLSTILLASSGPPKRGGGLTPSILPPPPEPLSTASVVRLLLILGAVLGLLIWIGFTLWNMPPPALVPELGSEPAGAAEVMETRREMKADERPSARVRVVRRSSGVESLDDPAVPSSSEEPAETGSEAPPEPQAAPEAEPQAEEAAETTSEAAAVVTFDSLADNVVSQLVDGNAQAALEAVDEAAQASPPPAGPVRLEDLRRMIRRGSDPAAMMLASLKKKVGETLELPVNGRPASLLVSRVEEGYAVMIDTVKTGDHSVKRILNLDPSKLALADQVRLLEVAGDPDFAVARVVLLLKGGELEQAAAAAADAGDLAAAFERYFAGKP